MADGLGVTVDLLTPAWHLHDEVRVPMTLEAAERPDWRADGGRRAWWTWRVTYRCPQCDAVVESEQEVRADVEPGDVTGWFHGNGPSST